LPIVSSQAASSPRSLLRVFVQRPGAGAVANRVDEPQAVGVEAQRRLGDADLDGLAAGGFDGEEGQVAGERARLAAGAGGVVQAGCVVAAKHPGEPRPLRRLGAGGFCLGVGGVEILERRRVQARHRAGVAAVVEGGGVVAVGRDQSLRVEQRAGVERLVGGAPEEAGELAEVGVAADQRAQQGGRFAVLADLGVRAAEGLEGGEEIGLPQQRLGVGGELRAGDRRLGGARGEAGLLQRVDHLAARQGLEFFDDLVDVDGRHLPRLDGHVLLPDVGAGARQAQAVGRLGADERGNAKGARLLRHRLADRLVARGQSQAVAGGDEQRLAADLAQQQAVVGAVAHLGWGGGQQHRLVGGAGRCQGEQRRQHEQRKAQRAGAGRDTSGR
jgi:hypothetical protein